MTPRHTIHIEMFGDRAPFEIHYGPTGPGQVERLREFCQMLESADEVKQAILTPAAPGELRDHHAVHRGA